MGNDYRVFVEEGNVISLRRAYVMEVDGVVSLSLSMEESSFAQQPKVHTSEYQDRLKTHSAYMYQYARTDSQMPIWGLRFFKFEVPPKFKLLWTDSGNSVAVYLNDEPWAFVDEYTQKSYSKGIMSDHEMNPWYRDYVKTAKVGDPWNQKQFETTFANIIGNP